MSLNKYFLSGGLIVLSLTAFSQTKDSTVFLKWKLKPNEVLKYRTQMKTISDSSGDNSSMMSSLLKTMGAKMDIKDFNTKDLDKKMKEFAKEMGLGDSDFITTLRRKNKEVINIEMKSAGDSIKKDIDTSADKGFRNLMKMMKTGVMLRGAIYDDGTIESFYTRNDQRNLISMFFGLPGKIIKIGDSWPLDVRLIAMDQNFICDSASRRNVVTLVSIETKNGEHIATLKYDILEYVDGNFIMPFNSEPIKTAMKMSFQGVGKFSVENGRWVSYDCLKSSVNTGMMTSQSTKKFSLIVE